MRSGGEKGAGNAAAFRHGYSRKITGKARKDLEKPVRGDRVRARLVFGPAVAYRMGVVASGERQ
ncbi:hypothetical protein [Pararhizobium antarcticum]|uniref:hypothetical protein n=1 Tax=Pararhizobium antarcticum TaxID=1798805 RepID=UPI00111499CE|nr:hypothetical protein [Pararhizobium antarcticum]